MKQGKSSVLVYMHELQSHQRHEQCTRINQSLVTKTDSESDTSHIWPRIEMVTHPGTYAAHCC